MSIFQRLGKLYRRLKPRTEVYALVGPSGSGKSFRAQLIAEKNGVEYIIDDGLLIYNQMIIAGRSAKKESLYLKAIKSAVFDDPEHLSQVQRTLSERKVGKILILGTSEKMVHLICNRLGLPAVEHLLRIEDVASSKEIELAQKHRQEGKHIIPIPAITLKRHYPTMLIDKIKIFFNDLTHGAGTPYKFEKSIVRPLFQQDNRRVMVSERALKQMVHHCVDELDSQITIVRIRISQRRRGYRISIVTHSPYPFPLASELQKIQTYIIEHIERYAGIILDEVTIQVKEITERDQERNEPWGE